MLIRRSLSIIFLALAAACGGLPGATPVPTTTPEHSGGTPEAVSNQPPPATPSPAALRHIRLPMGYIPSVQFAPFYVAVDKGYFAAEGLEIEFDYSFETDGVALVGAGQLPFAVVSAEQVLLARAQSLPVVYVLAWFQKFPVAIISKAEAGLDTPEKLRGKHIGTPLLGGANYVGLRAVLEAAGVPPEAVTIEAIGFNQVPALTSGQVDAAVVYANNEPIRLAAQGEKLNVIQVSDYATLAANGILTNQDIVDKDPDLVRHFNAAFVRGLADALAKPDEAFIITTKYVEGTADAAAIEKQVLSATLALWQTDHLGFSDPAAWDNMHAALLRSGLLSEAQDVSEAFTNEFVP